MMDVRIPRSPISRRACLSQMFAAAVYISSLGHLVALAEPAGDGWRQTQAEVNELLATCQYEPAVRKLSGYIKAHPDDLVAHEWRVWVVLDWLDFRDEFCLVDVPLRRRRMSDPATGLGNLEPSNESRRRYLEERYHEAYVPPRELEFVVREIGTCRKVGGEAFDERAMQAFLAEFVGDYDRAKTLIDRREAEGLASARDALIRCRILLAKGDLRLALAAADEAWQSPETRAQVASLKLNLLRALKQIKAASAFFDQWEAALPSDPRLLYVRASITLEGKVATRDFAELIRLVPTESSFFYACSVSDARDLKDLKACQAHLDRAIELNPRSVLPYYARSCVYLRNGNATAAAADANAAIDRNPFFDMPYQIRAKALQKLRDFEQARHNEQRRLWLRELYSLAANAAQKPEDAEASYLLAEHEARGGEWNLAMKSVSKCLQLLPEHVRALRLRSRIHSAGESLNEALADADRAIALDPDPAGYSLRGDLHARRADWDLAVRDYDRARCFDDRLETALRNRAEWHQREGRIEAAKADLERAGEVSQVSFRAE